MPSLQDALYDDIALRVMTLDGAKTETEIACINKKMNRKIKKILFKIPDETGEHDPFTIRQKLQKKLANKKLRLEQNKQAEQEQVDNNHA